MSCSCLLSHSICSVLSSCSKNLRCRSMKRYKLVERDYSALFQTLHESDKKLSNTSRDLQDAQVSFCSQFAELNQIAQTEAKRLEAAVAAANVQIAELKKSCQDLQNGKQSVCFIADDFELSVNNHLQETMSKQESAYLAASAPLIGLSSSYRPSYAAPPSPVCFLFALLCCAFLTLCTCCLGVLVSSHCWLFLTSAFEIKTIRFVVSLLPFLIILLAGDDAYSSGKPASATSPLSTFTALHSNGAVTSTSHLGIGTQAGIAATNLSASRLGGLSSSSLQQLHQQSNANSLGSMMSSLGTTSAYTSTSDVANGLSNAVLSSSSILDTPPLGFATLPTTASVLSSSSPSLRSTERRASLDLGNSNSNSNSAGHRMTRVPSPSPSPRANNNAHSSSNSSSATVSVSANKSGRPALTNITNTFNHISQVRLQQQTQSSVQKLQQSSGLIVHYLCLFSYSLD